MQLSKEKREIRFEILGEGHSFCNALQTFLLKDDAIEYSGYNIPHPLIGQPVFRLRTKEKTSPRKALLNATKALTKTLKEFNTTFTKQLKQ